MQGVACWMMMIRRTLRSSHGCARAYCTHPLLSSPPALPCPALACPALACPALPWAFVALHLALSRLSLCCELRSNQPTNRATAQ